MKSGMSNVLSLSGHPSWKFLNWSATEKYSIEQLKTYFMQLVFERGLLVLGTHNVTLAHGTKITNKVMNIYVEVLDIMQKAIEKEILQEELRVQPLESLFKVR
jgi:glutamate-1-semialdehyde 2,1-aminomutase